MDPNEVEGVDGLLAAGVGAVVAEEELVIVVDDSAPGGRALRIGPAVRLVGGDVHVREEGVDGLRHGVGPAEGSDDSRLRGGVLLLGARLAVDHLGDPLAYRPLDRVAPVGVGGEDPVGVGGLSLAGGEDVVHVGGRGWPVHEPGGLVGGVVEEVDADVVGDPTGDGDVLVRGDLPGERDHQPVAGLLGRVAVGGVEAPGGAGQHVLHEADGAPLAEVDVEGDEGAGGDGVGLAGASRHGAADEAADVLDLPLGGLGHGLVLGRGLPRVLTLREPSDQPFPGGGLVLPVTGRPRLSYRYGVFLHGLQDERDLLDDVARVDAPLQFLDKLVIGGPLEGDDGLLRF